MPPRPTIFDVMADGSPINLSSGLPETRLPSPSPVAAARLAEALAQPTERRRDAVADVAATFPLSLEAWAALGDLARDDIEAYAYYRVGYHRGLDALRANGWRGSGYVRGDHLPNLGFLRCLDGLRREAAAIGEEDEAARCQQFLDQLDPGWRRRTPDPA